MFTLFDLQNRMIAAHVSLTEAATLADIHGQGLIVDGTTARYAPAGTFVVA